MSFATSNELQELVDSIEAMHKRTQEMIEQHTKDRVGHPANSSTFHALMAASMGLSDARFAFSELKKGCLESEEKSRRAAMATLASISNN